MQWIALSSAVPAPSAAPAPSLLPRSLGNDLNNAPVAESAATCSVPAGTSGPDMRSAYLVERNSALLRLKQVCVDNDNDPAGLASSEIGVGDGDRRVVELIRCDPVQVPATDSRIVSVADDSHPPSPACVVSSPESPGQQADSDCLNALKILRETFPAVPPAQSPHPPSTLACPTFDPTVTFTSVPRPCSEVAPPVDPSYRRNISHPSVAVQGCRTTSQAFSSMLRKFRPRPQSDSGEDSCFDPSTPPPASPGSPFNPDDEDCAVDVTNLDTSNHCLPRAECDDALDEPIPSAQPPGLDLLILSRIHLLVRLPLLLIPTPSLIPMTPKRICC